MKWIKILMISGALLAAMAAQAVPPPAHGSYPGGWGMNNTNWETQSGLFTAWGLYDPLYPPQQGAAWVVGWDPLTYIDYQPITLELWIEMYMLLTYDYTSYQWHRLGDAGETISFVIQGTVQANSELHVSLMPTATEPLDTLYFREDIFGRTGPQYGSNLPITWQGRWGDGLVIGQNVQWGWEIITPSPGIGTIALTQMPACDHWFEFEGSFTIPYHQPDGYYSLVIKGCPEPVM